MIKRIFLILVLMSFTVTVFAQVAEHEQIEEKEPEKRYLYQWTDDKGVVHISDGLGKVPEEYRADAVRIDQPDEDETGVKSPVRQRQNSYTGTTDVRAKARWQQRIRAAKKRLTAAERRYQKLDQKRNELLGSWGGPASGRRAGVVEAEKVELEMKEVQREIDAARNERDIVIPEEARKAGIPPGWLRE
jgi:hypothetical protein